MRLRKSISNSLRNSGTTDTQSTVSSFDQPAKEKTTSKKVRMMKTYLAQIELEGPIAMFARPDTGGTPTSYPIPTWSAAKGAFESIAFLSNGNAWFSPKTISICKRVDQDGGEIQFQRMTMNYGGPLRKKNLFSRGITSGGSSMQLSATVLVNACFRIEAEVIGPRHPDFNPRHYLKHLFNRRLKQGRCWRTPCLGWSEFVCSYWGPYRTTQITDPNGDLVENKLWRKYCNELEIGFENLTEADTEISLEIPSMLRSVWNDPVKGTYSPEFHADARIENGVMRYGAQQMEASNAQ